MLRVINGEHFAFVEHQPAQRTSTASVMLAETLKDLAGVSMMDDGFCPSYCALMSLYNQCFFLTKHIVELHETGQPITNRHNIERSISSIPQTCGAANEYGCHIKGSLGMTGMSLSMD